MDFLWFGFKVLGFSLNPLPSLLTMSARDRSLFASMHMFIWISFVPLNPILVNKLVSNLSPNLLRVNLAIFPEFSAILYSSVKRHSFLSILLSEAIRTFLKVV